MHWLDSFTNFLDTGRFTARWQTDEAWQEEPWLGWLHIGSDVLIWICYVTIPIVMIALARKKSDVPFPKVYALFASFILFCSFTHLIDAIVFYYPLYRLATWMRLASAIVSLGTVIALLKILPEALALRGPRQAQKEIDDRTNELKLLTAQLRSEAECREKVLQELRENRELLRLAMTEGETGFFSWDLASDHMTFDTAESNLTGIARPIDKATSLAEEFLARVDPLYRERVRAESRRAVEDAKPYNVRFPFLRPDGKRIWLEGKGCVISDSRGAPIKIIGLHQDITAYVERENKLDQLAEQAQYASEQKSRFIAQVSHEIRTPLAAMLGCLDSLLMTSVQGDSRDILGIVRSQGELLQVLVNDVLDLSKMEAGKLNYDNKPVHVANVFSDVCSLMNPLAHEKGLEIRWVAETKLPKTIVCDPLRLKQVFVNIIGNAIKFTKEGEITIVARTEKSTDDSYSLIAEIRDTGCGIPRDKLDTIFHEFEQIGEIRSGYGLGLSICKRLIQLMGGEISVRSEVGIGSSFTVQIPIGNAIESQFVALNYITVQVEQSEEVSRDVERLPINVLAAEDTRAIQFVLQRMIGTMVSQLTIVENGRLAVEEVMKAEDSSNPFDLVLMDIQMPDVDGIEATRRLRREGFQRPIIALTAGAMEPEKQACITAGCTHFLAKPIDLRELRRLMQSISNSR